MARHSLFIALILVALVISFAGCRAYGYRPAFGGGPHVDGTPEWTFPVYIQHRPLPPEELKRVYPPENNISTK